MTIWINAERKNRENATASLKIYIYKYKIILFVYGDTAHTLKKKINILIFV